jgi:hypothetical protein
LGSPEILWLQQLHALGLWQASCRPDAEMGVLRTLLRQRATVIEHRASHMLHRQKPLTLMNMPWSEVLTEITGVTGQAILRATGATAHKIARVVYHLLKDRGAFQGTSAIEYEWERRDNFYCHRLSVRILFCLVQLTARRQRRGQNYL